MARVSLNFEPVPDVQPTGAPGNDYFHIQASPAAFGAPQAKGLETLGQGIERTAEAGFQVQQFHDRVAADQEMNNFIEQRTKIEYGDPQTGSTGYFGTFGSGALNGRQPAVDAINQARQDSLDRLSSPNAKLLFDTESRRMFADSQMRISRHADDQQKIWAQGVNSAGADLNLNGFAAAIGTGHINEAQGFRDRYIDANVKNAQLKFGNDPGIVKDTIAKSNSVLAETQANAMAVHNPADALKFVEENREALGARYDDVYNRLRNRAETQTGIGAANRYVTLASGGQLTIPKQQVASTASEEWRKAGASPNAIAGVMFNINEESSFNPGLRHPDQPHWGGEAHFAHGLYQEGGAEWNRYQYWLSINHPGSNWQDPKLQSEFAAWNLKTNYPGTWARMNAAATPQDAAAIYAREYLKPADQYLQSRLNKIYGGAPMPASAVGNVPSSGSVMRAGGFEPVGTPAPINYQIGPSRAEQLGAALNAAITDPDLNDHERDIAVRSIESQFRTMEIADAQTTKAKTEASNAAAGGYVTEIADLMHTPNPDYVALSGRIAHDQNLDWHAKEALLDRVRRISGEEQALAYGPGYLQAREALFSAQDAPGHIDDFSQLVTRPDITEAGLRDLHTRLGLVKGDVDRTAVEQRANSYLRYAKQKLSFEVDDGFFKLRDPKGEAIYNGQFVPDFVKRVSDLSQEAQRTGDRKKLDEFLSLENVEKMVKQYRNPQTMQAEKLAATGEAQGENGAPTNEITPPVPEGINPAGWVPVVVHPPITASGKPWPMKAWGAYLEALHKDPSEENKAEFDERFGKSGLTADKVLADFNEAPAKMGETAPAKPAGPGLFERLRNKGSEIFESERQKTNEFYRSEPRKDDREEQLRDLDRQQKEAEKLPEGSFERIQRTVRIQRNRDFLQAQ